MTLPPRTGRETPFAHLSKRQFFRRKRGACTRAFIGGNGRNVFLHIRLIKMMHFFFRVLRTGRITRRNMCSVNINKYTRLCSRYDKSTSLYLKRHFRIYVSVLLYGYAFKNKRTLIMTDVGSVVKTAVYPPFRACTIHAYFIRGIVS